MKQPREIRVSVRTLYRELSRIADSVAKGQRFAVTRHSKPIFTVGPVRRTRGARYSLNDLASLQWKGPKDLSQRVDETVYGR